MTDDNHQETFVRGRYVARESLEAADDPTAGPWSFGGVAVAPGDILHTPEGDPVLMTAAELEKAAATQAGQKLTKDHPEYDPGGSPPVDATVGDVTDAEFAEKGVVYRAQTHDADIAAGVNGGSYDVSVHATFEKGDKDPETGAHVAENITFHDLSIVALGDSPSNTAEWGAPAELAAWAQDRDFSAELTADESAAETGADQSLVSSAVDGTLRALGLTPGDVAVDPSVDAAAGATDQTNDPASDTETESMTDDTDSADDPSDPGDTDPDASEGNGGTTDDEQPDESNTVEVDLGEHDSLDALVASRVEAQVEEQVEASREAADKAEQVDEIIAHAEEYDEDDREDLLASPDSVVETTHKQATTASAPPAPGTTGRRDEAVASLGDGDGDDLDAYGTGVAEH